MNIRFEYLYLDAGNFKNWGEVIFANPEEIPAETVTEEAKERLIDGAFFVASRAALPDLHFPDYNDALDHGWHEAHSFEATDELANDSERRTISDFLESLRMARAA